MYVQKIQQLKNLRSLPSIRHYAQAGVRQRQYENRLSTKCMSRYFVFTYLLISVAVRTLPILLLIFLNLLFCLKSDDLNQAELWAYIIPCKCSKLYHLWTGVVYG